MPFSIIRNDITRVRADAIVNTANPEPVFAGGTDAAIYKAAGEKELLAERRKIGRIEPGEAVVTKAFALPARYIIHTSGPVWIDGNHGEYDILRSCYRKSLLLADQLGCESIAFPLIASGVYGFPKDKALEIALSVIRDHLENSDLDVTLVVFGRSAYQLASGLTQQVREYIDENYVTRKLEEEYGAISGSVHEDPAPEMRRLRRLWENLPSFGRPSSGSVFGSASSDTSAAGASKQDSAACLCQRGSCTVWRNGISVFQEKFKARRCTSGYHEYPLYTGSDPYQSDQHHDTSKRRNYHSSGLFNL